MVGSKAFHWETLCISHAEELALGQPKQLFCWSVLVISVDTSEVFYWTNVAIMAFRRHDYSWLGKESCQRVIQGKIQATSQVTNRYEIVRNVVTLSCIHGNVERLYSLYSWCRWLCFYYNEHIKAFCSRLKLYMMNIAKCNLSYPSTGLLPQANDYFNSNKQTHPVDEDCWNCRL